MECLKVGIVDDHPFVAKGLESIFSMDGGLKTAWAALDYEEMAALLEKDPVDVLVVDLKIGDSINGLRVLDHVAQRYSKTAAIVLSAYAPPRLVRASFEKGARGYFTKDEEGANLIRAIKEIGSGRGRSFYGPYQELAKPNVYLDISAREREVMLLIAKGKPNAEVAAELGLKVGTVKTHLESIYKKLGASNRTEAMRAALAEGYFCLEDLM